MMFSKLLEISPLFALLSSALGCVSYSYNENYDNGLVNAALTDNGQQTCAVVNLYDINWNAGIDMDCIDGFSAHIDLNSNAVTYSHPGFSGSFDTVYAPYTVGDGVYYTADSVWC